MRGPLSAAEFAAAVRRAAREIGEQVSCDARYIGRVESGAIRCPNYAYERVFLHMFPGLALTDLGFVPREAVRGHAARAGAGTAGDQGTGVPPPREPDSAPRGSGPRSPGPRSPVPSARDPYPAALHPHPYPHGPYPAAPHPRDPEPVGAEHLDPPPSAPHSPDPYPSDLCKESDVLRRAFITGGPAAMAAPSRSAGPAPEPRRVGESEAVAVEDAVRRIRVFDDRFGADGLYARAAQPLRTAYALLDAGARRQAVTDRLHAGTGELAISVGWLAHDSGRFADARSHYAEALAAARIADDRALEAHAFCNIAFLARDAGCPREAVRAAQAGQQAARHLDSPRLLSLLALREAGGWAGLGDRTACEHAMLRAHRLFDRGPSDADPEWMTFFGAAELTGLEAQCWSMLGDWQRAAGHARRAVALQDPHFARNTALYTAELAVDLAGGGAAEEAAAAASRTLELLDRVRSGRIRVMLDEAARALRPHSGNAAVAAFLARHRSAGGVSWGHLPDGVRGR
ncbi:hypothetical protein [Streptomyces sp. XD-27]|uniref:hypothetical protein n=1 Tax=Streptomyces sp. XD-27 TaxID=3062779 RepID=UPI0026F412E4|nr:hypothetical protein [Streptomyces sp. XD-27]WKX74220.1 hypothetical protein Q3Y56_11480 [Streptomyces sp. XD-27]